MQDSYRTSRLTGKPVPHFYIHSDTRHFKDTSGRTLILRGVNLSGSAKIPRFHPQHVLHNFWESAEQDGLHERHQPHPQNFLHSSTSSLSSSTSTSDSISSSEQQRQALKPRTNNRSHPHPITSSLTTDSSFSFDFDTQNLTPTQSSNLSSFQPISDPIQDTHLHPNQHNTPTPHLNPDNPSKPPKISYVGQNLNLEDGSADVHLTRLRQWGFNCLRFVTVWEALEHQGPGQYDVEYMDYVVAMLRKCKEYGFRVYMDPHQDLFSRFCGGSGAPLWTLYACGLNPRNFTVTGAAYLQAEWPHPDNPDPESFPAMIWATNYNRLACQTVNTMFWAGRDFAPKCIIDGVNIQDYLQYHFLEAYRRLAMKLLSAGDLLDETVIGWDSLNEPNHGYLGLHNLLAIPDEVPLRIGPTPTAYQGMKLGMGESCKLENYKFGPIGPQRDGSVTVDPKGKRAWLHPSAEPNGLSGYGWRRDPGWLLGTCIWAQHGVWDPDFDTILKPDYFSHSRQDPGQPTNFAAEYWRPHLNAYCHMIRQIHPEAILFVHPPVFEIPPNLKPNILPILEHRSVFSSHFYDGLTLITKHWNWFNADALGMLRGKYPSVVFCLKIGESVIRKCMRTQLGMLRQDGLEKMGEFPTMMGEIGIPYDLDKGKAYKDGDYGCQIKAMDASLNACDGENMLNYTLWTYCPSNSHQWGDLWNGEDLSLWSPDDAMYQGSTYVEKSSRYGKLLGRPFQHRYGAQSAGPTPNASAINLNPRAGDFNERDLMIRKGVYTPYTEMGSSQSSLDLSMLNLNDGARALPAFCRPFPVATVGTPVYFNFDISTASFELTVEVDSERDANSEWGNEELPTEIYVPAVHFGSSSTVCNSILNEPNHPHHLQQQHEGLNRRVVSENDVRASTEYWTGNSSGERYGNRTPNCNRILNNRSEDNSNSGGLGVHFNPHKYKDTLELEVTVSAGRWETEGQILRWFYPRIPLDNRQSIKAKYTIKVKRKSGPIVWIGGGETSVCNSLTGRIPRSDDSNTNRIGIGNQGPAADNYGRKFLGIGSTSTSTNIRPYRHCPDHDNGIENNPPFSHNQSAQRQLASQIFRFKSTNTAFKSTNIAFKSRKFNRVLFQ